MQIDGKDVAGMYQLKEEQKGVPPHWLSYVSVKSADESSKLAEKLGAKVFMGPFDVMDIGRMCVLQEPKGATLALWEPRKHIGARVGMEWGTVCWNELASRDKQSSVEFYEGLFGWKAKKHEGPTPYTEFYLGERAVGGMYEITPDMGNMPPNWSPYFAVSNCDESAERAKAAGATLRVPPSDIPKVGRFSVISDPQGATYSILKPMQAS
jgi:uncharacterized protein